MAYDTDETLRRNRSRSWWKQRTQMERIGIVLLAIAALIIIALIIAISVVSGKVKDDNADKSKADAVCLTPGCVKAAATVIQNMDESVNPCDDFYQFACGQYIKEAHIPEDESEINNFIISADVVKRQLKDILEEPIKRGEPKPFVLVKKFYSICMNATALEADGLDSLKKILKQVGGWPVLEGPNWDEHSFDWKTSTYAFRRRGLSIDNFINFGFAPDAKNSSMRTITLDQPELDVARDNLMGGFEDRLVNFYYEYMIDLAVFFGADRGLATIDVRNMINFKSEIAKISLSDEERRNVDALNNPMTIAEMQSKYRSIPWLELINNVISSPNIRVLPTEVINIMVPNYIARLEGLLQQSSKRDQANYAFFQTVHALIDYLPEHIRDRELQFRAIYSGVSQKPPRWTECVGQASKHLQIATSALYVRRHFREESKEAVREMVFDVRNEFVKIIEKLEWMDEDTRRIAIDKAMSMTTHIGYPIEFLDDKALIRYYSRLNFTSNNYFEVVNRIDLFDIDTALSEISSPVNKTDWRTRTTTTDINAGYVAQENSIQLPAGILHGIFYNKDRPKYMNYGSMGYIIGHEITHGFDDQGKKYNKMGDLQNWWAEKTDAAYAEKAKCFVKQYGDYIVPEVGQHLNGELTQGENIADNGGIKEAYLAYNSWVERNDPEPMLPGLNYTAKQLFWIATANCWCSKERKESLLNDLLSDEHAPSRYRVNIPFGNIHYFAEDFNCPAGSKIIPKQKCHIW